MKRIDLAKERPELEVAADAGRMYEEDFVELCVEETCEVYTPRGELLAKYLNGIVSPNMAEAGYQALRTSAGESRNRGLASGMEKGNAAPDYLKKDGTRSRTSQTKESVRSGIVGFYDRYTRIPYCRQTAWTMDNREKFMKAIPILFRRSRHGSIQRSRDSIAILGFVSSREESYNLRRRSVQLRESRRTR